MMQILQAPNDNTVDRQTSVGLVHFENGIATEFTSEQAQFFCERQRGYSIDTIGEEETPPVEIKTAERAIGNDEEHETPLARTPEEDSGKPAETSETGSEDTSIVETETESKEGQSEVATTDDPPADDGNKPTAEEIADSNIPTGSDAIDTGQESDESAEGPDLPGDPGTGDATETSQDAPGEPIPAPDDDGSETSTEDQVETETSDNPPVEIKLPTTRDSRKVVAEWCRENKIDDQGTKKELLERIYADERFKK